MGRSPAPPAIKRLPLSRRLVAVVLTAVGTGMIVSAAVSVWQESLQFVDGRREVLQATAQAFSAAAANAAASRDASGALAAIRAIGNVPGILYAEVRTAEGATLATLGSAPRLIGDVTLDGDESIFALFTSRTVLVSAPIVHGGEPAGRLILIGGTEGLWARLLGSVAITAFGGLMALIVGLAVGWRFQRGIAQPLQRLIAATAQVREQHRYDIALQADGDREVGQLIDGFNAMLSDIKERDARLEAHRRNLERDVADRTRDLRDARDAADAANRAKSDFLATMSHEIRTPMTGMLGFADLLATTPLDAEQKDYLDTIRSSAEALLSLINDILDFSKIEAGKLRLELTPMEVRKVVEKTVGLLAVQAAEKKLHLWFKVEPSAPPVIAGDAMRLRQILVNLLGNAIKFTSKGEVSLTVEGRTGEEGGAQISFVVRDTGPGIPPEHHQRIFDSFSQADSSISRQYGGTGLGLAISRSLALQMEGSLTVDSQPGQGATFRLTIPVRWVAGSVAPPAPKRAVAGIPAPATAALRVIVAEDNAVNRMVVLALLRRLGYQADSVANGAELLASLEKSTYDVVFMDVQMPGMDGLEATRRVRRDWPPERQPRIVAITADAFPEDCARCLEAGMDDYLSKPIDVSELTEVLSRVRPRTTV
jgi:two-component system, NarL family, sensor histidine kinase BarA